jgi:hypothetical protein
MHTPHTPTPTPTTKNDTSTTPPPHLDDRVLGGLWEVALPARALNVHRQHAQRRDAAPLPLGRVRHHAVPPHVGLDLAVGGGLWRGGA